MQHTVTMTSQADDSVITCQFGSEEPLTQCVFAADDARLALTTEAMNTQPGYFLEKLALFIGCPADAVEAVAIIDPKNGFRLHVDRDGRYVRLCMGPAELVYWDAQEFYEDADCVLGALCGAMLTDNPGYRCWAQEFGQACA